MHGNGVRKCDDAYVPCIPCLCEYYVYFFSAIFLSVRRFAFEKTEVFSKVIVFIVQGGVKTQYSLALQY